MHRNQFALWLNWVSEMYSIFLETNFIDAFESKRLCDLRQVFDKLKKFRQVTWNNGNIITLRYYDLSRSFYELEDKSPPKDVDHC